jgi:hypothetical protein
LITHRPFLVFTDARETRQRPAAGDRLRSALDNDIRILGLEISEREEILSVPEDPPAGLAELRGALLGEHEWRRWEGLA